MQRNYSIDLLKFLFAVSIAMGHFSNTVISSGTVVNMFFILSGYFLVNSYDSSKYSNSWKYSLSRLKRIYPYYLFAFVVIFLYTNQEYIFRPYTLVTSFFTSLPEIFLLQNVGIFPGGINYPLWQMCTLIVVSHVMFSLLVWNKQFTVNVLCPLLALGVYTYLANAYGSGTPEGWGVDMEFIYIPLMRAAANLSIGMFANYPINKTLQHLNSNEFPALPWLLSLGTLASLAVFWWNADNSAAAIPFLFLLLCLLYPRNIFCKAFRSPLFAKLDKLSLAFYVNHAFIIYLYQSISRHLPPHSTALNNLGYLAVLLIYSIVMLAVVDGILFASKKLLFLMKEGAIKQHGN